MRLERTTEGGFIVDAEDLGPLLEVEPAQVQGLMRQGRITSLLEQGEGEDLGRFRLTFRLGRLRVRLIVSADGRVVRRDRLRSSPPG